MFHRILGTAGLACVLFSSTIEAQTITAITLTASPATARVGQSITLQAAVTPVPVGGRVTFYDRSEVLGSSAVDGVGHALFTTASLLPLGHRLRAVYTGNAQFTNSLSDYFVLTISSLPSKGYIAGPEVMNPNSTKAMIEADFNADGRMDVILGQGPHKFAVYLGKGDGTFQPAVIYDTGTGGNAPLAFATGDMRGSGHQDLIVADGGPPRFFWNNGDATFTKGTIVSGSAIAVKVADFNRDGIPDLAFAGFQGLFIDLGNGDGTFKPWTATLQGVDPVAFDVADFDLDGKPDIVFLSDFGGGVEFGIMLNQGSGHLSAPTYYGLGAHTGAPQGILATDVNRDGRPDVAAFTATSAAVYLGDGKGGLGSPIPTNVIGPGANYGKFVGADLNGDGKPDLVVIGGDLTYALYGNGDGTFQTPVAIAFPPVALFAVPADFNGDGKLDLAFLCSPDNLNLFIQMLFGAEP